MTLCTTAPYLTINLQTMWHDTLSPFLLAAFIAFSLFTGLLAKRQLAAEKKEITSLLLVLFPVCFMGLLIFTKGLSMTALKGFLLFLLLFQASAGDIKTREVSNIPSIMILLVALIQTEPESLPSMLFALFAVGLPQLLIAMVKPGSYGGADIKITAASAFLLGVWKGLFAVIVGLIAAIVIPVIIRSIKKQSLKEGIPMIPFLSFGILLAFII